MIWTPKNNYLTRLLTETPTGERFCYFGNTVNQYWLLPQRGMSTALTLFMPSSWKGKCLKRCLPVISRCETLRKWLGASVVTATISEDFRLLCTRVLGTEDFQCSFFLGSPGKNQKTTALLSRGRRLLAYCKVTDNPEVYRLFEKEARLLAYLKDCQMIHVPTCLFCGERQGNYYFFQDTERTIGSDFKERWELAWDFVTQLHQRTRKKLRFEDTSYFKMLSELKQAMTSFPTKDADCILCMANEVCSVMAGSVREYSVYHGDFTPWNSFSIQSSLFAFDFEYAQYDYPPYLDIFHYMTQTANVEHREVDWIVHKYKTCIAPRLKDSGWDADLLYKMYLLDIIWQYMQNDQFEDGMNPRLMEKIAVWCTIIKRI
jgi:hypothetical protein